MIESLYNILRSELFGLNFWIFVVFTDLFEY